MHSHSFSKIGCKRFNLYIIKEQAFGGGAYSCHGHFRGEACVCVNNVSTQAPPPKAFMEHAQTCPNKSPPDVVAVMTQSLMTQQLASPPDVYSISVMTKSSSTGQISHDKFYYGQMIKLQKSE
jgi:hypothetical protein